MHRAALPKVKEACLMTRLMEWKQVDGHDYIFAADASPPPTLAPAKVVAGAVREKPAGKPAVPVKPRPKQTPPPVPFKPVLVECCICDTRCKAEEGVFCRSGDVEDGDGRHFACKDCFAIHVRTECTRPMAELIANEGMITCVDMECKCRDAFSGIDIGRAAPAEFALFLVMYAQVAETKARAEERAQVEREHEADQKRRAKMSADEREADTARKHIVEDILTLHCPSATCGQVFIDFESCSALSCSRCKTAFCAYCLKDCGADAHAHVETACEHKPTAMTGAGGYGGMTAFSFAQQIRKEKLVHAFVGTLPKHIATILMPKLAKDLDGSGIKLPTV
jgi:hypothetical protein